MTDGDVQVKAPLRFIVKSVTTQKQIFKGLYTEDLCYLVNKALQAAGMSADNVRGGEIVRKMNIWPRKRSFEGKCEIVRTISQPRTLSADIPAS